MTLSELIKKAQALLVKEGDLECMTASSFPLDDLSVVESDGSYPEDWDMPAGYKFVQVTDIDD